MVAEVAPYSFEKRHRLDPERGERVPGTDTGQHENLWRGDGTRRQDDAIPRDRLRRPIRQQQLDTGHPSAREEHPAHHAVRPDREVRAAAGRPQIGHQRTGPDLADLVPGQRPDAAGSRRVQIGALLEASLDHGLLVRQDACRPLASGSPPNRHRSLSAMHVGVGEVGVTLEPPVVRKHRLPRPFGIAEADPVVEVLHRAALRNRRVHRARAAHNTPTRVGLILALGRGLEEVGTVPRVMVLADVVRIADRGRYQVVCGVVGACLQQEDLVRRILAQPCGEGTPRASRPHNDCTHSWSSFQSF